VGSEAVNLNLGAFTRYARPWVYLLRHPPMQILHSAVSCRAQRVVGIYRCANAGAEISSTIEITPARTAPLIRSRQSSISCRSNDLCALLPFAVTTMVEPWRT
jgi:hypothetical protein